MNIQVRTTMDGYYYPLVNGKIFDSSIADILKIDIEEYRDNLRKYGAVNNGDDEELIFLSEEATEKIIEEYIVPLYTIVKLGE